MRAVTIALHEHDLISYSRPNTQKWLNNYLIKIYVLKDNAMDTNKHTNVKRQQ